jgi:hypothetical protein
MPDAPSRSDPDFERWFWNNVDDSDSDSCWLWLGELNPNGYGRLKSDGKWQTAHRVAWEMASGEEIPPGILIDHRCWTKPCVRFEHLRPATGKQNAENKRGARKDSQTGVRNVRRDGNKFIVIITHHGKLKQYGRFATIEEADARAKEVRQQLFTHSDM